MKKTNTKKLLLLVLAFAPVCAFAQQCNNAPVDGGLSFLAVAGVGYGIKKFKDSKTKNKQEDNK